MREPTRLELAIIGFVVYERHSFDEIARLLNKSEWRNPRGTKKWDAALVASRVGQLMKDGLLKMPA